MTRRGFLATASAGPFIARAAESRFNLLFLCSDQHQREASGCYGSGEVATPHIDEIARSATRFDRTYCQAPVCVPSRGSIVTGIYPHNHGARILEDPLPKDARTIGHFFREQGYVTGAIGKMHFVDETERHGFDHRLYLDDFLATLTRDEQQALKQDQGGAEAVAGRASKLQPRFFQDHWYAEKSVEFLRENRHRRFCLWTSFFMPHTPLVPLKEYFDAYARKPLSLPRRSEHELQGGFEGNLIRARERGWYGQSDEQLHASLAGYYGNITQMDACVGRVYDALHNLGLHRNTVVVYTSDHGEMAGAHRMWTKHNMYEQSVAVPLLVSLPDETVSGAHHEIIEHVDLFPTLTELCGYRAPKTLPGRSFAPLIRNQRYQAREFAYSEYYFCRKVFTSDDRYVGKPPMLMVRTNEWKLNYLPWSRSELYNMQSDPSEFQNRIDDTSCSGVAKELISIAERMFRS